MKKRSERIELLQGTLDMLILQTLLFAPLHGHDIGKYIQRTTDNLLQVQHGSLYPALHRLERKGFVVSKWETPPTHNREFKYYRLTTAGKKYLLQEESNWKKIVRAVSQVMLSRPEEG
jgi:transcriptional regulator